MPSLYNTLFLASLSFSFAFSAERRQLPADFSSLPSCGQSCMIGAATSGEAGCPITDFQCLANSSAFKNSVMKCVISTCSQTDMLSVAQWATKASAALGIPLRLPSAGSEPSASPAKATTPAKQKPDDSEDKPTYTKEQPSSVAKTDSNLTSAKNESSTHDSQDKSTPHHKKTDSDTEEGQTSSKQTQASHKSDYVHTDTSIGATPNAGMSLAALDFASLPKCGQTCLISSVTTSGGSCAMTDFACLSGSSKFKAAVAKCFMSSCSSADATASIQWSLKTAAALGLSVQVPSSAGHSTNATIGGSPNTSASINNTPITPISSNSMMNTSTPMVVTPTASLSSPSSSAEGGAFSGGSKLMTTTHVFSMTLTIVLISCIL